MLVTGSSSWNYFPHFTLNPFVPTIVCGLLWVECKWGHVIIHLKHFNTLLLSKQPEFGSHKHQEFGGRKGVTSLPANPLIQYIASVTGLFLHTDGRTHFTTMENNTPLSVFCDHTPQSFCICLFSTFYFHFVCAGELLLFHIYLHWLVGYLFMFRFLICFLFDIFHSLYFLSVSLLFFCLNRTIRTKCFRYLFFLPD